MFRIISGKWKAKKIAAPKNFEVRPTTDFAKEALFSILENKYDMQSISVLIFCRNRFYFVGICFQRMPGYHFCRNESKHTAFINSTASELDMALQINVQRGDVLTG
jgi:hypothetical protein